MDLTRSEIAHKAAELGIDRLGFVRWQDLEADAPSYDKPSQISTYLKTLIVLVKRYPTGAAISNDDAVRQYVIGRTARHLEEAAAELAYWLEERDVMAAVLSAMIPDLRRQPLGYSCPAGQGSMLLRVAAVRAGLGSLGLNQMLLTPEFGPRLFLSGVLTDLDIEPDQPFAAELCPGLRECGRCAAACPEGAIPARAREDAPLREYRGLDLEACARSSHPFGPDRMVDHLKRIFDSDSPDQAIAVIREKTTLQIWYNLAILRQSAFTGCMRCEVVCPIGSDYRQIENSATTCRDLAGMVRHVVADGFVTIVKDS
jgi:ferredoxin